jgi:hypothetical protein
MVNAMLTRLILVPTMLIVSVCAVVYVYRNKTVNKSVDNKTK